MKNLKFNITENGVEVTMTKTINNKKSTGFTLDPIDERNRKRGYICDVIGSFHKRLIASLTRRIEACQQNLLNHIDSDSIICHNDDKIYWIRKDGSEGMFSINSFNIMENAIAQLKTGHYWQFANDINAVEQTVKALLNDTEQDHSDSGTFRYSELVSVLTSQMIEAVYES